jgi:hypothetical protein
VLDIEAKSKNNKESRNKLIVGLSQVEIKNCSVIYSISKAILKKIFSNAEPP